MNKKYTPLVSVILIEYKKAGHNQYLLECLEALRKQTYKKFEIILESDHPLKIKYPKLKIIDYRGRYIPPAKKRDHGAKIAKGEIVAFLDDDTQPKPNWLTKVVPHFKDNNITGVGGPGITPPNVSWQEEASGWASASPIGSGLYTYRFLSGKKRFVDDYPSMNLAIRKNDFQKVGGFDSHFWPGEDTKLCLDLTKKLNKKIIYNPQAIVFHHRRPILKSHLKQNGSFGLHRGFFAKVLPSTSLRLFYFLPSFMLLGLVFIFFSFFFINPQISSIRHFGIICFFLYFLTLIWNANWIYVKSKSILQSAISIPVIFITHLWYGAKFIEGFLFTAKLKR
jgi:GT2 family glycosyltransferase